MNTRSLATCLSVAALAILVVHPATAQFVRHPFAVGASEGAVGHQNALGAWLLGQESRFYLQLTTAVRATKSSTGAALGLIGLSFAYGVFHAAGPGHGKAVITSYMVSNEVALRRGLVIAMLAAILQGLIATAIVGIAAYIFNATAQTMTDASQTIEITSYVGIVALGLALVWRKGRALLSALPAKRRSDPQERPLPGIAPALADFAFAPAGPALRSTLAPTWAPTQRSRFVADDGSAAHVHGAGCECGHMPDPALLSDAQFNWKAAALAVVTAGARPCSGAILVLVFSMAQGIFAAEVAATFAMSVGTALTTGALASFAVLAKDVAVRISGKSSGRALVVGRCVEVGAALGVLLFGLALLAAALGGVHTSA